jgi:hypothetical protein
MGCAPSHELLATWTKRETELVEVSSQEVTLTDRNSKRKEIRRIQLYYHRPRERIWDKQKAILLLRSRQREHEQSLLANTVIDFPKNTHL